MQTILLIGRTGQLGWELAQTLPQLGRVVAPDRAELDLLSADAIRRVIRRVAPDCIVNAGGLTVVDDVEREPDLAMQVNGVAPGVIAEAAHAAGAFLLHYSTAFVFDGTHDRPYSEDDPPRPVNAYGLSKLAGEQAVRASPGAHVILRCSWIYSARRSNFPLTIMKLARTRPALQVVDDQVGSPTWAREYAHATMALLRQPDLGDERSTYHLSAAGSCTRYAWARRLIESAQEILGCRGGWADLARTTTAAYPTAAKRPLYTVMSNERVRARFGIAMPGWEAQQLSFLRSLRSEAADNEALGRLLSQCGCA